MSAPLHVREFGTGPAIVLLHGAPTPPDHLHALAEKIAADGYRAIVPVLPGYAGTDPLEPYDLDRVHALLEDALTARDAVRPILGGIGAGAYRAFALACRGRLRARAVIALAGGAEFLEDRPEVLGFVRALRGPTALVDGLRAAHPSRVLGPRKVSDARAIEEVARWCDATSPANLANELEAFANAPDLRVPFAMRALPCVVRVGEHDATGALRRAERCAEAVRGARLERVLDVGHALLLEDFAGTHASIAQFAKGVLTT